MDDVLNESKSSEWVTPDWITRNVLRVLPYISLDPCSDAKKSVPADRHYTKEDDGLSRSWAKYVYLNPPYGREVGKWITKLLHEIDYGEVEEAIVVVAGRVDTLWFRKLADRQYPFCAVKGRVKFLRPDGSEDNSATFPTAIFYIGENRERFWDVFHVYGHIYRPFGYSERDWL